MISRHESDMTEAFEILQELIEVSADNVFVYSKK